jgi:predicted ArsR family transcriptional regulator
VRALAERRTLEGYLAEAVADGDGWLLVEHHCPICVAATSCQGLCRSELEVFQRALGDDVHVRREQHLLSGDTRCAYRISPA